MNVPLLRENLRDCPPKMNSSLFDAVASVVVAASDAAHQQVVADGMRLSAVLSNSISFNLGEFDPL